MYEEREREMETERERDIISRYIIMYSNSIGVAEHRVSSIGYIEHRACNLQRTGMEHRARYSIWYA